MSPGAAEGVQRLAAPSPSPASAEIGVAGEVSARYGYPGNNILTDLRE